MKERMWKFILDGFLILAFAVPAMEMLIENTDFGLRRDFLLLYSGAAFLTMLLLETADKIRMSFWILPIIPVAELIISRDMALLWNCLAAYGILGILVLILRLPFRKWILPIPLIVYLIYFIPQEGTPGYVAGCIVLELAGVISGFLSGEHRDRWVLLLGLTAMLACMIPSGEEPMKWEGVRSVLGKMGSWIETGWKNISYFVEGLFGDDEESYVGYSETGGLNGGLGESGREELYFRTMGRKQPTYLNGAVYGTMGPDGFTERITDQLPVNGWLAMYLNAIYNGDVTQLEAACFSRVERAEISYAYIRTSDLLIPATTFRVDRELKYGLTSKEGKGFTFDANYISVDNASKYFRRLCKNAAGRKTISYEQAEKVAREIYSLSLAEYLTEEEYYQCLEAYQAVETDPVYLDTSMTSERTAELAAKITADSSSDMEKARKIEAYLRQYPYDLSVDLRGRENYVDAFLFEEQKGYCIHYASAMICMLRSCGIPARLVQGFLYSPNEEGVIYGGNAHAWVEAYMSGVGWVRFEPTASEQNADDYGWRLVLRETDQGEFPEETTEEEEVSEPEDVPEPVRLPAEITRKDSTSVRDVLITVGYYVLAVLGMVGVLIAGYLLVRWIMYQRMTPEQKLKHDVQALRKKLDAKLPEGERAESVFDYIPYIENEEQKGKLEKLFRGYYRVRFRGDAAEADLVTGMRSMLREVR